MKQDSWLLMSVSVIHLIDTLSFGSVAGDRFRRSQADHFTPSGSSLRFPLCCNLECRDAFFFWTVERTKKVADSLQSEWVRA